ncbi:hypothetical protein SAMN02746095_03662 [Acidocella aminolytica 101 = DSM 11237]|nr:hypothetical protein SAMN02746095_03662 [Acidocella aminolytica 101 = DSM 11237]
MVIAFNALFFFGVLNANAIQIDGLSAIFKHLATLAPVGIAAIVVKVVNALPSADVKATLVFWRLKHAPPGHRAFSVYAQQDTRINQQRLKTIFKGTLPSDPADQNAAWYKLYRPLRDDVIISSAHKLFLLLRDYTAICALLILTFGPWALIGMASKNVAAGYVAILLGQYLIVRMAAANAGIRMVTNVLALKTAISK